MRANNGRLDLRGVLVEATVKIAIAVIIVALVAVPQASAITRVSYQNPLTISTPGQSKVGQNAPTLITAFDTALNAHDTDTALALFSDIAVVNDPSNIACLPGPPPVCQGYAPVFTSKVQIRGWLEQLSKDNIQVQEVGSFQAAERNLTWTLAVSVDEYRRLNVAPLVVPVRRRCRET
jgi:hypothetical protein